MDNITLAVSINDMIDKVDGFVWGWPLIILILVAGIWLTCRTGFVQIFHLGKALKYMVKNESNGEGDVTSFGALCTALSATIGTGNIVGVATAICLGGRGALFWMLVAAFFGMATKYSDIIALRGQKAAYNIQTDTSLVVHSIISKKVWGQSGNGLQSFLLFLVC